LSACDRLDARAVRLAPEDLIVQLGPCIRPPHYEIDFAADVSGNAASEA
jgi:copper oxidase (laccase) domain-containing protein